MCIYILKQPLKRINKRKYITMLMHVNNNNNNNYSGNNGANGANTTSTTGGGGGFLGW